MADKSKHWVDGKQHIREIYFIAYIFTLPRHSNTRKHLLMCCLMLCVNTEIHKNDFQSWEVSPFQRAHECSIRGDDDEMVTVSLNTNCDFINMWYCRWKRQKCGLKDKTCTKMSLFSQTKRTTQNRHVFAKLHSWTLNLCFSSDDTDFTRLAQMFNIIWWQKKDYIDCFHWLKPNNDWNLDDRLTESEIRN